MKSSEITASLRRELSKFKETETFKVSDYAKEIVTAIETSMSLLELAEKNKSRILDEDKHWFKGDYQVAREFEEDEWQKISILYSQLAEIARRDFW